MTGNKGAAIERGKLLAKLRRMKMKDTGDFYEGYNVALENLAGWIRSSADRAAKVPGGLGRNKKG